MAELLIACRVPLTERPEGSATRYELGVPTVTVTAPKNLQGWERRRVHDLALKWIREQLELSRLDA